MNAARRAPSAFSRLFSPAHGRGRGALIAALLVAGLTGGAIAAWKQWGPVVTQDPRFLLNAEQITITPPPPWILADVKSDVVRDGSLSDLNLLDPQLTEKVAAAFALHTWVASVDKVVKQPGARVSVSLTFRKPTAFVKVPYGNPTGMYPVDAEGVFLPPQNFAPAQVPDYLRIIIPNVEAPGPPGEAWGSPRVVDACKIAAAWGDRWKSIDLYGIEAVAGNGAGGSVFELFTKDGMRIVWGAAPGNERAGEPGAVDKVARLLEIVAEHGKLDKLATSARIDLRNSQQQLRINPRTVTPARLRAE